MKLIIDCVLKNLDLAILDKDNKIIKISRTKQSKNLSEILIIEIEKIIKESKIEKIDINSLYIVNGPGSFTSLKLVAIFSNIWKYENDIDLFKINTCLWNSNHDDSTIWFDAKSNKIFYSKITKDAQSIVKICSKNWFNKNIKLLSNTWELDEEQEMRKKIKSKIDFFEKVNHIFPNYIKKGI